MLRYAIRKSYAFNRLAIFPVTPSDPNYPSPLHLPHFIVFSYIILTEGGGRQHYVIFCFVV